MKLLFTGLFLLLTSVTATLFAQQTRNLSSDSLQTDFEILTTTLRENHPLMRAYLSQQRFDSLTSHISGEIRRGLTATQFYTLTAGLLAKTGCGHTYVRTPDFLKNKLQAKNDLPFDVLVTDSSIVITTVYLTEYAQYAGSKITKLNNLPAGNFIRQAYALIPADGFNTTYKQYRLAAKFNNYLNLVFDFPETLTFETEKGTIALNAAQSFKRPTQPEAESEFYALPGSPKTMVLKLADFDGGKRLIRKCFRQLSSSQTQNLILDLRNNGGGNGNIGSLLLAHIVDSAITHYLDKSIRPVKYKALLENGPGFLISNKFTRTDSLTRSYYFKVLPKQKYNFNGAVYVLTNGGTFSTAAFVASVLKHKSNSILVGEETGGSEYAIGGGVMNRLVLPYSQLTINLPMYAWRFNATTTQTGSGVLPAITLKPGQPVLNPQADAALAQLTEYLNNDCRQPQQVKRP